MDYRDAWKFLDNLQFFKIKLGLDSMKAFLAGVGNPEDNLQFVHVAGTNGKGSVAIMLLEILSAAGYSVGLYTSPHLSSVRERFRINDQFISQDDFTRLAERIIQALEGRQITYFEFTTALALMWFEERKVDLVILEVGLGGRLDATNVITPLVSVITNVSMDHEAYLGNSLAEVAGEKAGIIKQTVPVVSGVANDVSREVVDDTCRAKEAPLYLLGRNFSAEMLENSTWTYKGIHNISSARLNCNLRGEHQIVNSALALATLELLDVHGFRTDETAIQNGLARVKWPGRLEYFCLSWPGKELLRCSEKDPSESCSGDFRQYLLDGAHNPAGVASLKDYLIAHFEGRKIIMVWASMADKDIPKTLAIIAPICERIVFTMPESERSAKPEDLRRILPGIEKKTVISTSVGDALGKAATEACKDDLICVAGSLYLIGAARALLLGELTP